MAPSRDVLLTGSVPLRPAEKVFETVARHLGGVAPRIPDGEQIGWSSAARRTFERHPALEAYRQVPLKCDLFAQSQDRRSCTDSVQGTRRARGDRIRLLLRAHRLSAAQSRGARRFLRGHGPRDALDARSREPRRSDALASRSYEAIARG